MHKREGGVARVVPCAIVSRNAVRALSGVAAVGVRVMMCSFVLVVAFVHRFVSRQCDARSRAVARFRASWCNGRPREIAWRVCVFRVSLCKRLFVVAPLVWLRVRWLCVTS